MSLIRGPTTVARSASEGGREEPLLALRASVVHSGFSTLARSASEGPAAEFLRLLLRHWVGWFGILVLVLEICLVLEILNLEFPPKGVLGISAEITYTYL